MKTTLVARGDDRSAQERGNEAQDLATRMRTEGRLQQQAVGQVQAPGLHTQQEQLIPC
jgi:hypothetical protein